MSAGSRPEVDGRRTYILLSSEQFYPREDCTRMSGVSGDLPVQLATRLPDWSVGGLLSCSASRLSVCRVVLEIPRARDARLVADSRCHPLDILVRPVPHARFPRNMLATSSWGWREDVTRKLILGHLSFTPIELYTKLDAERDKLETIAC